MFYVSTIQQLTVILSRKHTVTHSGQNSIHIPQIVDIIVPITNTKVYTIFANVLTKNFQKICIYKAYIIWYNTN